MHIRLILVLCVAVCLILSPVAATEVVFNASNDGFIIEGTDAVFPTMRAVVTADSVTRNDANYVYAGQTVATTTTSLISSHARGAVTFQTGTIPDAAIINSVVLRVRGNTIYNTLASTSFEIIDFTPGDSGLYVTRDYSNTTFTRLAPNITAANFSTTGYNNFTYDATGLATVNKLGNSTAMLTNSADVENYNLSLVWSSGTNTGFRIASKTTATPPQLIVTYTAEPTSTFTVDYTGGISPLLVNFTDTTTGDPATAWAWYDDDVLFNTTQNPQFVPFTTGNHQIKLNASNAAGGTNSSVTWINVTDAPALVLPVPDFSANTTSGHAIQFTDLSASNILGWNWSFGDGYNSTASNPVHTYETSGTYTVILEVVNISGYNTTTKTNYITGYGHPTMSFTKNRPLVLIPQLMWINVSDTNTPTSYNLSWGDGGWSNTTVAAEKNASHTYRRPGLMTLSLTVSNAAGTSSATDRVWVTARSYQLTVPGREDMVECEYGTYSVSLELSAIERLELDARIAALCN